MDLICTCPRYDSSDSADAEGTLQGMMVNVLVLTFSGSSQQINLRTQTGPGTSLDLHKVQFHKILCLGTGPGQGFKKPLLPADPLLTLLDQGLAADRVSTASGSEIRPERLAEESRTQDQGQDQCRQKTSRSPGPSRHVQVQVQQVFLGHFKVSVEPSRFTWA